MDVQLAGLFWSTCGAKLKHFALKLDCASPSPHSAPAWPRNETARGSAHHWKHSRVSEWHPCDGDATTTKIATVTRHKFPSCFRQIDPLVATEVWPCSLWPNKKPGESADVEIVFQTAGSGFPGPLGASSGTAGLQEGSPFDCATHLA